MFASADATGTRRPAMTRRTPYGQSMNTAEACAYAATTVWLTLKRPVAGDDIAALQSLNYGPHGLLSVMGDQVAVRVTCAVDEDLDADRALLLAGLTIGQTVGAAAAICSHDNEIVLTDVLEQLAVIPAA